MVVVISLLSQLENDILQSELEIICLNSFIGLDENRYKPQI